MHPTINIDQLKNSILEDLKHMIADKQGINEMKERVGCKSVSKDAELSRKSRARGNNLYASNLFDPSDRAYQLYQTLHIYNESIAYAPVGSQEIALAYANRSAILRRMRRYWQCITEIDKALAIIDSTELKVKLYCRQAECYTFLGIPDSDDICRVEAKYLYKQIQDRVEVKRKLLKLIKKARKARYGRDDGESDDEYLDEELKEGKRILDSLGLVEDLEQIRISDQVKIECSEEYGRHLVAARDFEPGEIIMLEKPYRTQTHWSSAYQYCYHCLNYLWTVYPCNHCTWRLYCSEECKIDSWNDYHELECSVISNLRIVLELEENPFIPYIISIFSKALKEAGSIDTLRSDLESLDDYNEIAALDAPPMSYKSIYTSPIRSLGDDESANICCNSILALIGLAKYSTVFGRSYDFDELEELTKNDSAIFVGAFLTKISWLIASRCTTFKLYNPGEHVMIAMQRNRMLKDESAGIRRINMSLEPTMMLSLIGCVPNIGTCRTHNTQSIVYALQPIKAGTQLVVGTISPTIYDYSKKKDRQMKSWLYYEKDCDCQACTENWSRIVRQPTRNKGELWEEMCSIMQDWEKNSGVPDYPNIEVVNRIRKLAAKTWVEYPMPSAMYVHVVRIMDKIFQIFFTPSEIIASATDLHEIKIRE